MSSLVFNNFISYTPNTTYPNTYWINTNSPLAYSPVVSEKQQDNSFDEKTVGMAALLQAIAMGLQKGSQWFARKLESGKEFTSADNVKAIASKMVRDNNLLDVTVDYISDANKYKYTGPLANEIEVVAKGKNAFYADQFKLAVAPESKPSLILHELGHASNSKNFFLKLLQKSRKYAVSAPMALLVASKLFGDNKDGKPNFIERNAGILGFVAFLPTIIEEGMASLKGINAAKKMSNNLTNGSMNLGILKRNYLLALGTYVLAGIGLGVAAKQTILENSNSNNVLTK